jgi:hypothetical protein
MMIRVMVTMGDELLLSSTEYITLYRPRYLSFSGNGGYGPTTPCKITQSHVSARYDYRITWSAEITAPGARPWGTDLDGRGYFGFLQRVRVADWRRGYVAGEDLRDKTQSTGTEWAVDIADKDPAKNPDGPLYNTGAMADRKTRVMPKTQGLRMDADKPGEGLTQDFRFLEGNREYETYAMYRPDGDHSIWVPIGIMKWKIDMKIDLDKAAKWVIKVDNSTNGDATCDPYEEPPRWSMNTPDVKAVGYRVPQER